MFCMVASRLGKGQKRRCERFCLGISSGNTVTSKYNEENLSG